MRFKNLRIAVGASLVIFIFLVGTVLLIGQLSDKSKITIQNTNLQTNVVPASSDTKKTPAQITQDTSTDSVVTDTSTTQNTNAVPIVYHQIRTRAS